MFSFVFLAILSEDDSPLAPDLQLDWFSSTEEEPSDDDSGIEFLSVQYADNSSNNSSGDSGHSSSSSHSTRGSANTSAPSNIGSNSIGNSPTVGKYSFKLQYKQYSMKYSYLKSITAYCFNVLFNKVIT